MMYQASAVRRPSCWPASPRMSTSRWVFCGVWMFCADTAPRGLPTVCSLGSSLPTRPCAISRKSPRVTPNSRFIADARCGLLGDRPGVTVDAWEHHPVGIGHGLDAGIRRVLDALVNDVAAALGVLGLGVALGTSCRLHRSAGVVDHARRWHAFGADGAGPGRHADVHRVVDVAGRDVATLEAELFHHGDRRDDIRIIDATTFGTAHTARDVHRSIDGTTLLVATQDLDRLVTEHHVVA